jgi:serine/threonine protein kinase
MFFKENKKQFTLEYRFYVVMEFCENGTVEDLIKKLSYEKKDFTDEEIEKIVFQICQCLYYLHSQGILHRDIKSENMLLMNNYKTLKVCDFGFTKKADDFSKTVLGTVVYMAPEILKQLKYDSAVDIWSLGVILFQMLTLKTQNQLPEIINLLEKNVDYIKNCLGSKNERVASIAIQCLKLDPIERPTAKEIIDFLKDKKSKTLEQFNVLSKSEVFYDNNIKETDIVSIIKAKKASDFWINSGFNMEVEWTKFFEKYIESEQWLSKTQSRGMKKLCCYVKKNENTQMTSVFSFKQAILKAGFPFSGMILETIDKYSNVNESSEKRNYNLQLSKEEYEKAKKEYLNMIIENDKIFVDPITQEILSIDQHCAPLKLASVIIF